MVAAEEREKRKCLILRDTTRHHRSEHTTLWFLFLWSARQREDALFGHLPQTLRLFESGRSIRLVVITFGDGSFLAAHLTPLDRRVPWW